MNQRLLTWIVPMMYLLLLFPLFKWGAGISHDSCNYLSAAQLPLHEGIMQNCDGSPFTNWPFLYPFLLRILQLLPFPLLYTSALLQLAAGIATYLLLVRLLKPENRILAAALFMFPLFVKPYLMVWTEPLFICAFIAAFFSKAQKAPPIITTALLATACLTRYAGLFIVGGLALGELVTQRRLTRWCVYYLLSLIPLLLNILYNISYQVKIIDSNLTLRQWTVLQHNLFTGWNTLLIPLHITLSVVCYTLYKKTTTPYKPIPVAIFLYWLVILIFDPLSTPEILRYLLPVLPLLLLVFNHTSLRMPDSLLFGKLILVTAALSMLLTTVYSFYGGTGGYNKTSYKNDELNRFLSKYPDAVIYSNAPDYLYYLTSGRVTHWLHDMHRNQEPKMILLQLDQINRPTEQLPASILPTTACIKGNRFTAYMWP